MSTNSLFEAGAKSETKGVYIKYIEGEPEGFTNFSKNIW